MAGTATCLLQNASGIPMLRRICQERDASQFTRLPLMTMTVVTLQIGLYGYFMYGLPDGLQLLLANAIGLCLWVPSFFVFLVHTRGARAKAVLALQYLAAVGWGVALPVCLFTSPALSPSTKQNTLAVFMQIANFSGFFSPVASLRAALAERSARRVPGMLSYVNVLNSALWTAYGAALGDGWILWPNVAGLLIALSQVAVLLVVRRMEAHDAAVAAAAAAEKGGGLALRAPGPPADAAFCAALPKAELHRHVHGSLRPATLLELLRANAPPRAAEEAAAILEALAPAAAGARPASPGGGGGRHLRRCFSLFDHIHAAVRSEADLARVVREALEDAAADSVFYLELRTTPRALSAPQGAPPAFPLPPGAVGGGEEGSLHRYVAVVVAELARARDALPRLTARLLLSANRAEPLAAAAAIFRVAVAWAPVVLPLPPLPAAPRRAVVGLDLGGNPLVGALHDFLPAFAAARAAAAAAGAPLGVTLHAGEVGGAFGAGEVEEALAWGPQRVGHLALVPPHRLLPATAAAMPVVELCPSSNEATLALDAAKGGLAAHPSMGVWLRGARVAICTDDPGVFVCTLSGEYAKTAAAFGLGRARVAALARAAFDYAFLPAAELRALVEGLPPVEPA